VMGDKGGSMGGMEMPLPENTLPMMSGEGQFGQIDMGGMFTTVKVREGLARNDYKDPGWYKHPKGSVAAEWSGDMPAAASSPGKPAAVMPGDMIMNVKKRGSQHGH
jgi:hypothetical protein